jgi:hypothetical protein
MFRPPSTPGAPSPNEPDTSSDRPRSEILTGPGGASLPERTWRAPSVPRTNPAPATRSEADGGLGRVPGAPADDPGAERTQAPAPDEASREVGHSPNEPGGARRARVRHAADDPRDPGRLMIARS